MSEHIKKRHNKTLLLYHIVCPMKYRKSVITKDIGESLKEICLQISKRYEIHFVEIGQLGDQRKWEETLKFKLAKVKNTTYRLGSTDC